MKSNKITYISLLQIVGPLFVVLGHSINGLDCSGAWYVFSKEWIYIFHMPLFFLVSGYLMSYKNYLGQKSYGQFVWGKFKRLLIPYLVWNLIFWIPKFFAQTFIADEATLNIFDALKGFVFPRQNVWGHTWFLMGLFIVYLASPLFQKILHPKRTWVSICTIVGCVILYVLPIHTEFLALSDLHKDLLFFVIGCILGQIQVDKFVSKMRSLRFLFILGSIAFSAIALIWFEETKKLHFIPCLFILLALLSIFCSFERLSTFWENLASCSFSIYIMHWPVMIVVRIILNQIFNVSVPITATVMVILGYIIPIIVIMTIRALPFEKFKKMLKYLLGV